MDLPVQIKEIVNLKLNSASACHLLDTGSQVITMSFFFQQHLFGDDEAMLATTSWLKITAVNGLEIPHEGYVELELETMGLTLIVQPQQNTSSLV